MKNKIKLLVCSLLCFAAINVSAAAEPEDTAKKIKPIPVENIKYNKGLNIYSYYTSDKAAFKEYTEENKIVPYRLKSLYNRVEDPTGIVVSALAYDYAFERPDLAENFYALFTPSKMTLDDRLRHADFLLRTGRVSEISTTINKVDCMKDFKKRNICYYYLGLEEYLRTGDYRNRHFNLARSSVEKAELLYKNGKL